MAKKTLACFTEINNPFKATYAREAEIIRAFIMPTL